MKHCKLCGGHFWGLVYSYPKPDKYEKGVGLINIKRCWHKCLTCGLYNQFRDYPLSQLERIYENEYRSKDFRGETIKDAFIRIMDIPNSENDARVKWLTDTAGVPETLLDIGSGIGVFPCRMKEMGSAVLCTEENIHSLEFINDLGIKCVKGIPDYAKFEMVSLVHVLEHFEDPVSFLKDLKKVLQINGKLFIEVPDAEAFEWLDKDHDDFNSCHICSYTVSTLYGVLRAAGFDVTDMHRQFYPKRQLSRIMGIAKA
ncbi:MAG: class I SAM-dependent methyltransferase [Deltaproteobacteria bacterium]|nr:class I SAM-dependent methyltransferase [Deltaproteobacteria bacterium]